MEIELRAKEAESYYDIVENFEAVMDSPPNNLAVYEIQTNSEILKETLKYVNFGYTF